MARMSQKDREISSRKYMKRNWSKSKDELLADIKKLYKVGKTVGQGLYMQVEIELEIEQEREAERKEERCEYRTVIRDEELRYKGRKREKFLFSVDHIFKEVNKHG